MLVGPLMVAPFVGRRAIKRRSPDGVRTAATQMRVYGFGSILTALLGVLLVQASDNYKLTDVWIVISMTLYVVALCLVFFYAIPALRRAARLVEQGVMAGPETGDAETELTTSAAEIRLKEQLDAITGRVAMAGLLVLSVFVLLTILMVVFGD
jgi:uncharacterized membrane protein